MVGGYQIVHKFDSPPSRAISSAITDGSQINCVRLLRNKHQGALGSFFCMDEDLIG